MGWRQNGLNSCHDRASTVSQPRPTAALLSGGGGGGRPAPLLSEIIFIDGVDQVRKLHAREEYKLHVTVFLARFLYLHRLTQYRRCNQLLVKE